MTKNMMKEEVFLGGTRHSQRESLAITGKEDFGSPTMELLPTSVCKPLYQLK